MNMHAAQHRLHHVAGIALLLLVPGTALGSARDEAEQLRGQSESAVRRTLHGRGYEAIRADGMAGLQFWWDRAQDRCLEVHYDRGRVTHAEVRDEKKCRKASKAAPAPDAWSDGHGATARGGAPVRVSDLVGTSARNGDSALGQRGFVLADERRGDAVTYRWYRHPDTRQCVMMEVQGKRIVALDPAESRYCRRPENAT